MGRDSDARKPGLCPVILWLLQLVQRPMADVVVLISAV